MKRFFPAVLALLTGVAMQGCEDAASPVEVDPARLDPAYQAQLTVVPIPQQPGAQPVPAFVGDAASPVPVFTPPIPQNRFLAPNGLSNVHNDAYMSDTYATGGPLSYAPMRVFSAFLGTSDDWLALPISMAFDRYGRILTITAGQKGARLVVLFNNHYSGLHLGPDGTIYVGVGGGVVALRDGR
jgi:hypothetical protein